MSDARWDRIKRLFNETLERAPAERPAFLDGACRGDAELRREVESLLAARTQAVVRTGGGARAVADAGTAAFTAAATTEHAGTIIGPYKLLQQIGEGGFGMVFLAEQTIPVRRRVAVKIIKLGMDTRAVVARFEAERQALALMDHPHIAKVLDGGATDAGRPYFVMEYVTGDSITGFCDAHRLDVRARLELFAQVCAAVQHAHQKGVIHRDIKPGNVLVSMSDGKPFAKVIDFGIAKATAAPLTEKTLFTEHRQLIGTPEYMSPEQAEGSADIDTRTDVYALGVLLYELLSGLTPFDAARLRSAAWAEMQRIIKEEEPPAPSVRLTRDAARLAVTAAARRVEPGRLGTLVKGELDWIVMKALDKDRARRYDGPAALAADVRRHLSGEPVQAAPPAWSYRARKFVRKHRGPVAAAACVAVALLIGIVATARMHGLARYNEDVANHNAKVAEARREQAETAQSAEAAARRDMEEALTYAETQRAQAEQDAYVANIFAAAHDPYTARDRLDALDEHLRGWEWGYLNASADASTYAIQPPAGGATWGFADMLSPDGTRFLTTARGYSGVEIRETATGRVLHSGPEGWGVNEAMFSPDGALVLLTGIKSEGGGQPTRATAEVYDPATGRLVPTRAFEHHEPRLVRFFPDGARFLTHGCPDCPVQVWDTRTGTLVRTIDGTEKHRGCSIAPDGKRIVTSYGGPAAVWDAETGERLLTLLCDPGAAPDDRDNDIVSAQYSPDGTMILTSSNTARVRLWDAATGALLATLAMDETPQWNYARARFSTDGSTVVTWADGRTVAVWDVATGAMRHKFTCQERDVYFEVVLSPDGTRILTTGGPTPHVWDMATGRFVTKLVGHVNDVTKAAFSSDGSTIITSTRRGDVRAWDTGAPANPAALRVVPLQGDPVEAQRHFDPTVNVEQSGVAWRERADHPGAHDWHGPDGSLLVGDPFEGCTSVGFSPDGGRLVFTALNSVFLWDVERNRKVAEFLHDDVYGGYLHYAPRAMFLGDGKRVLSHLVSARVWDAGDGGGVLRISHPDAEAHAGTTSRDRDATRDMMRLRSVSADAGGERILTVFGNDRSPGGVAWVTRAATGERLLDVKLYSAVNAVISPDGSLIAACEPRGGEPCCRVLDVATGAERILRHAPGEAFLHDAVAFSPDGSRLITIGREHVHLWDLGADRRVAAIAHGCSAFRPFSVFNYDGTRALMVCAERGVVIDAVEGRVVAELTGHVEDVSAAAFSPDGTRVVTAGGDQTIRFWDAATGRALFVFREHAPTDGEGTSAWYQGFTCLAFSPDGTRLATGTKDGRVLVFDTVPWRERRAALRRDDPAGREVSALRKGATYTH